MAEGYVMTIPKEVLDKLTKADNLIVKIGEDSEKTRDRVKAAFQDMANGVTPFIEKVNALKNLGKIKLDATLKSSASAAESAASSVAQVATQLNRVADSPVEIINRKIESMRDLLNDSNTAIQRLLQATAKGVIPMNTMKEAKAGTSLIPEINQQIYAFQLERDLLSQNDRSWKTYIDNLTGASIAAQRQKKEMEDLNSYFRSGASLLQKQSKAEEELAREQEKSARAAEKRAAAEKKLADAQKKKDDKANVRALEMYNNAIERGERTIIQRENKIRALAKAQEALSKTGRNYSKELNKIELATKRLQSANENVAKSYGTVKKQQDSILNTSDQLKRKLGLLFSVSAMQGYLEKLVKVRGEFELQQRSLQSILQDKEKADQIWDKTVQLAIRSPFTVKELVTYTKQLAAYRIESDKLYDTNKMLADVSAGLGVSMDRLILAYGQVKAANYLRASEVRQFTEAGVNMLGELSDIYSELEGRMVTVGEVQDRITKRMVSFGDVEEVFKRITSAGGLFYNMQEVQAETLAGIMSNLQDTFDIMFNDIGKANDGILKEFVSILKDIVGNWQTIAQVAVPIIETLASRWVLMKTATLAADIAAGKFMKTTIGGLKLVSLQFMKTTAATTKLTGIIKASTGASVFGGWLTILSAVAVVVWEIYNAISATKREQEAMNKIVSEGAQTAGEMSQKFKQLADAATDSTKSTKEQQAALSELKRTYSDIIPVEQLTIENLKQMKGNYDAVTNAIYAKIEASTREKMLSEVQTSYGETASNDLETLRKALVTFGVSSNTARQMVYQLREDFEAGLIKSPQEAVERIKQLISQFTLLDSTLYDAEKGHFVGWGHLVTTTTYEAFKSMSLLKDKVEEINGLTLQPLTVGDIPAAKEIDSMFNAISDKVQAWKDKNEGNLSLFDFTQGAKQKAISQYEEFIKSIQDSLSGEGVIKLDERSFIIAQKYIERAQKEIDNIKGNKAQKEIERLVTSLYKLNQVNLDGVPRMFLGAEESIEEYTKRVKGRIELLTKLILEFKTNEAYSPFGEANIKDQEKELVALQQLLTKLPQYDTLKSRKGVSEADKLLKKQIELLKEVGREYKNNLKYYSQEEAMMKTRKDYLQSFKELGLGDLAMTMTFDPSGIINGIQEVGKKASQKMKYEVEKAISGISGEVDLDVRVKEIEATRKEIEELFSGYELSIELGKLGLDKSLISQLFKVDTFDLDSIKKKLSDIFPDVSKLSQEQLKVYNDTMKKISDMEQKELETRFKEYSKYLKRTMSERVRIEMEAQDKINKIPKEFQADQRQEIIDNIRKETQKNLDKQAWSDFKGSDLYIKLFEDLDNVSTRTLEKLREKLLNLKNSLKDLPAEELKAIVTQLNKVEDEIVSRNPFKGLISNLREYFSLLRNKGKLEQQFVESSAKSESLQKQIEKQEKAYELSKRERDEAIKTYGAQSDQAKAADKKVQRLYTILDITKREKNVQDQNTKSLGDQIDKAKELGHTLAQSAQKLAQGMNEVNGLLSDIQSTFGEMMSDDANAFLSTVQDIVGGIATVESGISNIADGKAFTGTIQVLSGLVKTIGSVFAIGDKKREREIQNEMKNVEKLQKAYEKLEKAIDKAYTIDTLNRSTENAQKNLDQQIENYQKMIAAEEGKKKSDKERIEGWKNTIKDLEEKRDEIRKSKLDELGGFGSEESIKSAAESFADAWLDAYQETGDGLDALNDKWDEYINNIIKKQLVLRATEQFLKPVMDIINKALEDSYLDIDEKKEIDDAKKRASDLMNLFFKDIVGGLEIPITGGTDSGTTLSKGIQSVTEETANVIEAYLNSMRFFVSDSNMQLQRIASFFTEDPTQSPLISELMSQTRLLRSIDDRLSSVITSAGNHPHGGSAIKALI